MRGSRHAIPDLINERPDGHLKRFGVLTLLVPQHPQPDEAFDVWPQREPSLRRTLCGCRARTAVCVCKTLLESYARGAAARCAQVEGRATTPVVNATDNATLSFYATKDGKISVSYQGWDTTKTVLAGQQFVVTWSQGQVDRGADDWDETTTTRLLLTR